MKIGRIIAMLLTISLLALLLVGCEKVELDTSAPPTEDRTEENVEGPEETPGESADYYDYEKAYAAFAPDTVFMTVDGKDVTWADYYCFLGDNVYGASVNLDMSVGWDMLLQDDFTIGKYVIEQATYSLLEQRTILSMADSLGITISEEEEGKIEKSLEDAIAELGSEEEVLAVLKTNFFSSIEQYKEYMRARYLTYACFVSQYGESGALVSDAALTDYTKDEGYLMAKHILIMKVGMDETGSRTELSEEAQTAAEDAANEILDKLDSFEGQDFEAYFTELMNENTEDTGGLAGYPDGYLFKNGDMVPEFYEGTMALEIGEYSRLVESSYGYHIIYRIPINYDVTPMNMEYNLRIAFSEEMFFSMLQNWQSNLEITYTDAYNSIDLSAIFIPNA